MIGTYSAEIRRVQRPQSQQSQPLALGFTDAPSPAPWTILHDQWQDAWLGYWYQVVSSADGTDAAILLWIPHVHVDLAAHFGSLAEAQDAARSIQDGSLLTEVGVEIGTD